MKTLLIHGSYASDGSFILSHLSGDTGGSVNDFNLAMQAIRLRGTITGDEKYLDVIPLYQFIRSRGDDKKEQVRSNTQWNIT